MSESPQMSDISAEDLVLKDVTMTVLWSQVTMSQLRRNNKQTNTWTITLLSMVKMTRQEQSLFTLWFIIPHLYSERLVIQIHSSLWLFSSSILIILGWVLHLLRHSDTSLIFADFILNNFVQLVQSNTVLETPAIRILLCDSKLTSLEDLGAAT